MGNYDSVVVPPNMRCIYKPIYEIPVASIFNGESAVVNVRDQVSSQSSFIAPKAKILIVDDNAVNHQVASGLMQPYKMQIFTIDNGADAIMI